MPGIARKICRAEDPNFENRNCDKSRQEMIFAPETALSDLGAMMPISLGLEASLCPSGGEQLALGRPNSVLLPRQRLAQQEEEARCGAARQRETAEARGGEGRGAASG